MMRSLSVLLFSIFATSPLFGIEKLQQDYLICYGNPDAQVKVIHYFSFKCPHCIELFQDEFKQIKSKYLDTNQVYWVFHPVPMDLLTVQGMDCLAKLNDKQKKMFLEAILEETALEDPILSAYMMEKAMEIFGKPIPKLQEKEYIAATNAFQHAFKFLSQTEKIIAIPTAEINGELFSQEIPDIKFIESKLKFFLEKDDEI